MQFIMGAINGHYLRDIVENAAADTEQVLAAVAYATDSSLLFDWCRQNEIPIQFFGRLDDGVAVSTPILSKFLSAKSARYRCYLVQHHHAKLIWWRGYGVYIGSANLTRSAWYTNIEAGCFFLESEVTDEMAADIFEMFRVLEDNATPLTEELLSTLKARADEINKAAPSSEKFWRSPSLKKWSGLVQTGKNKASETRKLKFLEEWHQTLQLLRDIGDVVSRPENKPIWVQDNAPIGAQADQFLHAHYYHRTFEGRKARYLDHFNQNKADPDAALNGAISWWRDLPSAPSKEDEMLNENSPALRAALTENAIDLMSLEQFRDVCIRVHSIKDYARRVSNQSVGLLQDGTKYTIPQKVDALSKKLWVSKSANGVDVRGLLKFILYGGADAELPERLWLGISDNAWKIEGLGVSALGELVGWSLPDIFPPRNGRTSKSLKSLGFPVNIHVG